MEKLEYLPLFGIFTSFLPLSNPCCFLRQSLAMALLLVIWRQFFLEWHFAVAKIIPFNFINPLIGPNNFVSQFAPSKHWQILLIQSCLKIFKLYFILTPCSLSWLLGFIKNLVTIRNKTNPTQIFSNLSYLDQHYIICFQTLLNQRINLLKKKQKKTKNRVPGRIQFKPDQQRPIEYQPCSIHCLRGRKLQKWMGRVPCLL